MDVDVEARLIEQEHRLVLVFRNFLNRRQWEEADPRRQAARSALLWRVLAPASITVAGGGLVAVGTLLALLWQTRLIGEQNQFFKEQNTKLQAQIDLQADQDTARRRTEVIANLYETLGGLDNPPRANARTRAESVVEFVRLERLRLSRQQRAGLLYESELNLSQARLDGLNLGGIDLHGAVLTGTWLQNTDLGRANLRSADFRAAYLESTGFARADLREIQCEGCNFIQAIFAHADLRGASLRVAQLRACEFLGADLRNADLTGVREWAPHSNFRFANISGMRADPEFLQFAKTQGAVEIPKDTDWITYRHQRFPDEF